MLKYTKLNYAQEFVGLAKYWNADIILPYY